MDANEIIAEVEAERLRKDEAMRGRIFGRGEAVLRAYRRQARRAGDKELVKQLDEILADTETAAIAGAAIEDEAGGGFFRDILKWIVDNPEQFKDLIQFLIGLFTGLAVTATKEK